MNINDKSYYYPVISDQENFPETLLNKTEFSELLDRKKIDKEKLDVDVLYNLRNSQEFARRFMNKGTPYDSILLLFSTGVGKTISAISIAENFSSIYEKRPLLITKNDFLKTQFKDELVSDYLDGKYMSNENKEILKKNKEEINEVTKILNDNAQKLTDHALGKIILSASDKKVLTDKNKEIKKTILANLESNKKIVNLFKLNIRKKYQITTYDTFINDHCEKKDPKDKSEDRYCFTGPNKNDLDDRVIIIDEIQNIINNDRYILFLKMLKKSKNNKLVLLSATPMMDSIIEIIQVTNLLNFNDPPFVNDINTLKQENIIYNKNIDILDNSMLKKQNLLDFTPNGNDILNNKLFGKVLYGETDTVDFPSRTYNGDVDLIANEKWSIPIVRCRMSNDHFNAYRAIVNSKPVVLDSNVDNEKLSSNAFHKKASDISTIYIPNNLSEDVCLKKENLKKYSTKLHHILQNIEKKEKGLVFIYSNYVEKGGTMLISRMLELNGFNEVTVEGIRKTKEQMENDTDSDKDKEESNYKNFIRIVPGLTEGDRKELLETLANEKNNEGKYIRIIIGSPMISEGVSFKNIRQCHILEPYWNMAKIQQIIGRCIRNESHKSLPKKDKHVDIYLYESCGPRKEILIDGLKYILAQEKDIIIKNIYRQIKINSLNCAIENSSTKDFYEDYSPECDYQLCKYECLHDIHKNSNNDESTYNNYTSPYHINLIKNEIIKMFQNNDIYDLEKIKFIIKTKFDDINDINIYYAINELLVNKDKIYTKLTDEEKEEYNKMSKEEKLIKEKRREYGFLEYRNKFYIFKERKYTNIGTKKEIKEKEKQSEEYEKTIKVNKFLGFINPILEQNQIALSRIKKKEFNANTHKIDLDLLKKKNIYGYIDHKDFKIVNAIEYDLTEQHPKKLPRGRTCTTMTKADMIKIIEHLGYKINQKVTKDQLCSEIHKILKQKNLIK